MFPPFISRSILIFSIVELFCFNTGNVFSQSNANIQSPENADLIRKAETLYFYGLDLSHLRISDGLKVSRGPEYSKVYPQAWINSIEKEIVRNHFVQKSLRKRHFYYKQVEIISTSVKVVPDFIISKDYFFPLDTVKAAIANYDLQENSGIGLVFIPENFNKYRERAYTWIVFFDIKTREVLWAAEESGACRHMGYTAHWTSGIVEGFKRFVSKDYHVHHHNPAFDPY
jgi:hypothetical protein